MHRAGAGCSTTAERIAVSCAAQPHLLYTPELTASYASDPARNGRISRSTPVTLAPYTSQWDWSYCAVFLAAQLQHMPANIERIPPLAKSRVVYKRRKSQR